MDVTRGLGRETVLGLDVVGDSADSEALVTDSTVVAIRVLLDCEVVVGASDVLGTEVVGAAVNAAVLIFCTEVAGEILLL